MFLRLKNTKFSVRISKNIALKMLLIFGSVFSVFLMTGLLYFRNDVKIVDGASERIVYTVNEDPAQILNENFIDVGPYDRVDFTGFTDNEKTAVLTITRAFAVPVTCNGEKIGEVYNIDSTVEQLLEQFGIEMGEFDGTTPSKDSVPTEGSVIDIKRAYDVVIEADGTKTVVKCLDNTTKELLDRAGITMDEDDMVSEAIDKVITESTTIKVSRVLIKKSSVTRYVPYETKYVADNLSVIGTSEVRTDGVDGIERTTTEVTYIDGEKTGESVFTEIVRERVDEVIAEGKAVAEPYCKLDDPSIVLENGRPVNYEYIISGKATAYTAPMGAYTASGRLAEIGTCAVNPNVIPYGSLCYIVGQNDDICYGYAIAADTGDGMMDGTIPVDVYMGNREDHYYDSCQWGLQYVDIYVIKVGNG